MHVNVESDLVRVKQDLSREQIRTVLGIVDSSPVASSVAAEQKDWVLEEELLERSSRQIVLGVTERRSKNGRASEESERRVRGKIRGGERL
jgi:hypothetical protein